MSFAPKRTRLRMIASVRAVPKTVHLIVPDPPLVAEVEGLSELVASSLKIVSSLAT